ncbi:Myb-like domain-containing protein [Plasmodiophora brassicae]|uniref:Myb-like domain-containing protein n=1 Tax=Plasmodiophora brassicae TaxID=37360 RepID=A0A0G4IPK0_PLABS|nr:hypothetical protein PBRA_005729 [Plasmodiophora brassicae]SPR01103.1 unnamed protein product [Plasmodiophora brassicae]
MEVPGELKGGRLRWTSEDVANLMTGVLTYGHAWSTIVKKYDFRGRNAKAISDKFYSIAGKGDRRSIYSPEEEADLIEGVKRFGCRSWKRIVDEPGEEGRRRKRAEGERADDDDDDDEEGDNDDEGREAKRSRPSSPTFVRFQSLLLAVAAEHSNNRSATDDDLPACV